VHPPPTSRTEVLGLTPTLAIPGGGPAHNNNEPGAPSHGLPFHQTGGGASHAPGEAAAAVPSNEDPGASGMMYGYPPATASMYYPPYPTCPPMGTSGPNAGQGSHYSYPYPPFPPPGGHQGQQYWQPPAQSFYPAPFHQFAHPGPFSMVPQPPPDRVEVVGTPKNPSADPLLPPQGGPS
jgi:hypothetical protein